MNNDKLRNLSNQEIEQIKLEAEKTRQQVVNVISKVSKNTVEREEVLKLSFLCAMAGESIFMLGPPGIAKSLVSRKVADIFRNSNTFEVLMNRYSTPDEIFGPIDIVQLKQGKYVRKTDGYLPTAEIGFLDEI